jgi:hypothetical protein
MTAQRRMLDGDVDFTMMYLAHDAFARDLRRIAAACERGDPFTARTRAGWAMFTEQLHVHHRAEDASLWPSLRARRLQPDEELTLDAMELEHVQLDPQLEHIDAALAEHDADSLTASVQVLSLGLTAHMRHEENDALPLVDRYLGRRGWDEFARAIRKAQGGLRGGAVFLPWALDAATADMQRSVFALLPRPARVLYRRIWEPKYRRANWWDGTGEA